ncbi:MAG: hypothetical protein K6W08_14495 [Firmicutes bacterium]|nr:hypothetical protein [Bacillota bacterium]
MFDITFQDMDGERRYVWQTSWGVSTRLIGAIVMVHGDRKGLRLPPLVAPIQVVIVPIWRSDEELALVRETVERLQADLARVVRLEVDWSEQRPGWKFNEWEMRGVPLRVEIGPRDVARNEVVLVRRTGLAKEAVSLEGLPVTVERILREVQDELMARGRRFLEEHITEARTVDEVAALIEARRGFVRVGWCGRQACEETIRDRTGASPRVIPLDDQPQGACIACGQTAQATVYYARAY